MRLLVLPENEPLLVCVAVPAPPPPPSVYVPIESPDAPNVAILAVVVGWSVACLIFSNAGLTAWVMVSISTANLLTGILHLILVPFYSTDILVAYWIFLLFPILAYTYELIRIYDGVAKEREQKRQRQRQREQQQQQTTGISGELQQKDKELELTWLAEFMKRALALYFTPIDAIFVKPSQGNTPGSDPEPNRSRVRNNRGSDQQSNQSQGQNTNGRKDRPRFRDQKGWRKFLYYPIHWLWYTLVMCVLVPLAALATIIYFVLALLSLYTKTFALQRFNGLLLMAFYTDKDLPAAPEEGTKKHIDDASRYMVIEILAQVVPLTILEIFNMVLAGRAVFVTVPNVAIIIISGVLSAYFVLLGVKYFWFWDKHADTCLGPTLFCPLESKVSPYDPPSDLPGPSSTQPEASPNLPPSPPRSDHDPSSPPSVPNAPPPPPPPEPRPEVCRNVIWGTAEAAAE